MNTCSAYYQSVNKAFAYESHGTPGGVSTWARGGNFSIGFASGTVASFMTTTADVLTPNLCEAWQVTCMVAAGTLSGGVTSTMAGGDFWDGVCNGLICAGLNHAMHLAAEGGWRTVKYVNKLGWLPLDYETSASQWANYKMQYNVTLYELNKLDENYQIIGKQRLLTISAVSTTTCVVGDVHASAKAIVLIDGMNVGSEPLVVHKYEQNTIIPEHSTFVGSASFVIPETGDVSINVIGGWNVYLGSGSLSPAISPVLPVPINANIKIQVTP